MFEVEASPMFIQGLHEEQRCLLDDIRMSRRKGEAFCQTTQAAWYVPQHLPETGAHSVYQNNFRGALTRSVYGSFPLSSRHMPSDLFNDLVNDYSEQKACETGDIESWPSLFVDFVASKISQNKYSGRLPSYLPDCLRLEWAIDCATRASIQAGDRLTLNKLQQLSAADQLESATLSVNKSLQLLKLPAGMLELWRGLKNKALQLDDSFWRIPLGQAIEIIRREHVSALDGDEPPIALGRNVDIAAGYYAVHIMIDDSVDGRRIGDSCMLSIEPLHSLVYAVLNALPDTFCLEQLSSRCENVLKEQDAEMALEVFIASVLSLMCERKYLCLNASGGGCEGALT
ncbi:HvfC/BufC family peptide modification chaperone [Pseudoteredinibacter isoporae]|uniref:HvfC/BufC family peptide modification chaperone n=1 Tax=Pseudoteredinibacter isoporae TaxID=570281 RepID=UPI00310C6C60